MLRWQVGGRLTGMPAVMPFVPPTRLLVHRGLSSATANLYAGLTDFAEMGFVLHLLRPGDLMGDIGANIGVYTVLAAGVAGAEVAAVEPSPTALRHLWDNIRLNDLGGRVTVHPVALGEGEGSLRLSARLGAANRVLLAGEGEAAEAVPATTLDRLFADRAPILLKLDVEGYELRILSGGAAVLARPGLRAVLLETAGHGERYGEGVAALDRLLRGQGFAPFDYDPERRALTAREGPGHPNSLYLRDGGDLRRRLSDAPPFTVLGQRV